MKPLLKLFRLVVVGLIIVVAVVTVRFMYQHQASNEYKQKQHSEQQHSKFEKLHKLPFKAMDKDYKVSLPADFRFHPKYQHEWWHYFANVTDEQGKEYSVQWSFLRVATDARDTVGWQNPQLFISSIIVTSSGKVWKEQRIARGGIGQAGLHTSPFRLWMDDWEWDSLNKTPLPGRLTASTDHMDVSLRTLQSDKYYLHGDHGYQKRHQTLPLGVYGFSAPFLQVRGTLTLDEHLLRVSGHAWLQKEWGNAMLSEGSSGWDWFVFQLKDKSIFNIHRFRYADDKHYMYATITKRNGEVISLSENEFTLTPLSPNMLKSGRMIPLKWMISVPKRHIYFTTHPVYKELWQPHLVPHWEGPVWTSGSHRIRGFMQLSGY